MTMKPIAVIQHTEVGAPGAVAPILLKLGRELQTFRIFRGDPVPAHAEDFSGILLLGGSMGVLDPEPWIPQEIELVRAADRLGLPVAGHCLGSQMIAFALGGSVQRHTRPEIGWQQLHIEDSEAAREWLGEHAGRRVTTFQWHQDTFIPGPGAVQLARSPFCENQAFVLRGRHLLVQSHLEITPELVEATLAKNRGQLLRQMELDNPAAQAPDAILADLPRRTAEIHQVLRCLYQRWVRGCRD